MSLSKLFINFTYLKLFLTGIEYESGKSSSDVYAIATDVSGATMAEVNAIDGNGGGKMKQKVLVKLQEMGH